MANPIPVNPRIKNKISLRQKPLSFSQVFDQKIFLLPAGGGLIVIALALVTGSPFEWIVIFGYLFALPFWFQYVRQRPMPKAESAVDSGLTELNESLRAGKLKQLGVFFEGCLEDSNLEDIQVRQAIKCYKVASESFQLFEKIASEIADLDKYSIEALLEFGYRISAISFDRLKFCAVQFGQLSEIDSSHNIKKVQQLSSRKDLSQKEALELKTSKEKGELRIEIISRIFNALETTLEMNRAFQDAGREYVESRAEDRVETYAIKIAAVAGNMKTP